MPNGFAMRARARRRPRIAAPPPPASSGGTLDFSSTQAGALPALITEDF